MIACPNCGAENAESSRFCGSCGSSLVPGCTRCGAELPEGARFCSTCGTPVASLPEPGRERKVVTILFADVTGSTALAERLDPEALQGVMGAFFTAMREEIEAEGGTVEKFIGDAVMAAFGVPAAHEDDPARAVRAARRMLERLGRLNRELAQAHGVSLEIRIGINTGEVIATTDPRPGEPMVAGDAVNVAARLEQSTEPGTILVSERTARAARGFGFEEVPEELELRGRERPVTTYRLRSEAPDEVEPARGIPGLRAPLVGRDEEMSVLQSVFRRAASEGHPHLVTIYGDPGVGKSRLTAEFLAWAEGQSPAPLVVRGRCLPYGDGVTYWPLGEILKGLSDVLDSDAPGVALGKIRAFASTALAEGLSPDPGRAAAALAYTVGLGDADHPFAELSPRQVQMETHAAWRSLFSGLARERPVLVVVEDIHWADPALLDLLEELADRLVGGVLLVCPARPELTQRRAGWGGGHRNVSSVFLEPLSNEDARLLVGFLLAVENLPDAVRDRILGRAEGNPFFLEEIIRHLIDEGRLTREGRRWRAVGAIDDVRIPDTVQGVLAARIDLLAPPEKRALQSAAVVGRVFWSGPVEQLLNGEAAQLDELLARLEDRELVAARVASTIGGEREYTFKHVLTRDVAYSTLPRTERSRAHERVGRWIEKTAGQRVGEFAELLAYHALEAHRGAVEDPSRSPGETGELRGSALRYLLLAAREARSRLALDAARRLAEQAASIAATGGERALALDVVAAARFLSYDGDGAWETYGAAIEALTSDAALPDPELLTRLCASRAELPTRWPGSMNTTPSAEEVRSVIDLGLEHLPSGDSVERVRLLVARAFWPFGFPDDVAPDLARQAAGDAEEAAAMAQRIGRPDLASAALDALASSDLVRGDYGHQAEVMERRLALVPQLDDPFELGDLYSVASWGEFHIGRYGRALAHADEGVRRAEGSPGVTLHALSWRVLALVRTGGWADAVATLARVNEMLGDQWEAPPGFAYRAFGGGAYVLECMANRGAADRYLTVLERLPEISGSKSYQGAAAWVAEVLARRGEFDRARRTLDAQSSGTYQVNRGLLLEARCEVLAEAAAWEEAPAVIEEARAHARESGLMALPAFADRLEGRAAQADGRPDAAARALRLALDRFASLEAGWEEARTRLDLAAALVPSSPARAKAEAAAALEDLERIGAVREIAHARDLLSSLE